MGLHRVPQKDEDFHTFINASADYLQKVDGATGLPNWQRLDLVQAEFDQWQAFRTGWNDAYGTHKTNLTRGIRDSNATDRKNNQRILFTKWALSPEANKLNRIKAARQARAEDRAVFNIRLRAKSNAPRPAITTAPAVALKAIGGGIIQITCRMATDSDRPSMHPHADTIEMKYILLEVDAKQPKNPQECPHTELSTKAIFLFSEAQNKPGKRLYAFFRWRNDSHPHKSGPWSQVKTTVIGD